jgi:hypothetical protein
MRQTYIHAHSMDKKLKDTHYMIGQSKPYLGKLPDTTSSIKDATPTLLFHLSINKDSRRKIHIFCEAESNDVTMKIHKIQTIAALCQSWWYEIQASTSSLVEDDKMN